MVIARAVFVLHPGCSSRSGDRGRPPPPHLTSPLLWPWRGGGGLDGLPSFPSTTGSLGERRCPYIRTGLSFFPQLHHRVIVTSQPQLRCSAFSSLPIFSSTACPWRGSFAWFFLSLFFLPDKLIAHWKEEMWGYEYPGGPPFEIPHWLGHFFHPSIHLFPFLPSRWSFIVTHCVVSK